MKTPQKKSPKKKVQEPTPEKVVPCCGRDHGKDGGCDRHPFGRRADGKCAAPVPGGCGGKVFALELCEPHYRRRLRNPGADLSRPVAEDRGELETIALRVPAETVKRIRLMASARSVSPYSLASKLLEMAPEAVVALSEVLEVWGPPGGYLPNDRRGLALVKAARALEQAGLR